MYEIGIVFHVIKKTEELIRRKNLTRVNSITLELGEITGIVPEYLIDGWGWASRKNPLLKGSVLKVEQVDAVTSCCSCGKKYFFSDHGSTCPFCHSQSTILMTGNEINIKEIEAY